MAEKLRAASCAAHKVKEKHTRIVEREKTADQEKHVASASRKLRADKKLRTSSRARVTPAPQGSWTAGARHGCARRGQAGPEGVDDAEEAASRRRF